MNNLKIKKSDICCPNCFSNSKLIFKTKDYNRKVSNRNFYYYKCNKCKYIFLNPIPNDLDKYYPENYHFIPNDIEFISKNSYKEKYKIDLIRKYKKKGKLLEIGPSFLVHLFSC